MKAIFFDIDGTLINYDGVMPESAKKALRLARENGHKLFLCSGRPRCMIAGQLLGMTQDTSSGTGASQAAETGKSAVQPFFDGMICSSGAYIECHGRVIYHSVIRPADLSRMVDYLEENHILYNMQCAARTVYTKYNLEKISAFMGRAMDISQERSAEFMESVVLDEAPRKLKDVEKLMYYDSPRSFEEVQAAFGEKFNVVPTSFALLRETSAEVTQSGINKAVGIRRVLEHLGLDIQDSVAFGDAENDLEMLEYVGTGVAMGNACEEIKARADRVTTGITEDGIYNGMKMLGLLAGQSGSALATLTRMSKKAAEL